MFRIFCRPVWKQNPDWPNGWEPYARPIEKCRPVMFCNTKAEAVEFCDQRNKPWRQHASAIASGTASASKRAMYYGLKRYEWIEE